MAREDVLEYLKSNRGRWFTCVELKEALNLSPGSVAVAMRKLRRTSEIKFKEILCDDKHYRVYYSYGNGDPSFHSDEHLRQLKTCSKVIVIE